MSAKTEIIRVRPTRFRFEAAPTFLEQYHGHLAQVVPVSFRALDLVEVPIEFSAERLLRAPLDVHFAKVRETLIVEFFYGGQKALLKPCCLHDAHLELFTKTSDLRL